MANLLGFIDETGVLQRDLNQRFFGLGLLQLKTTAPLHGELVRLKSKIITALTHLERPFEFKFNDIHRTNFPYYHSLLDLYFSYSEGAFSAFVIDKQSPQFKMEKFFKNTWEAYIGYSQLVIDKNVGAKDRICVLADFLFKTDCVVFDFRMKIQKEHIPNESKRLLVEHMRRKLKVESLAGRVSKTDPNYFSIWPFKMGQ